MTSPVITYDYNYHRHQMLPPSLLGSLLDLLMKEKKKWHC
jgi:hypothetical protein